MLNSWQTHFLRSGHYPESLGAAYTLLPDGINQSPATHPTLRNVILQRFLLQPTALRLEIFFHKIKAAGWSQSPPLSLGLCHLNRRFSFPLSPRPRVANPAVAFIHPTPCHSMDSSDSSTICPIFQKSQFLCTQPFSQWSLTPLTCQAFLEIQK